MHRILTLTKESNSARRVDLDEIWREPGSYSTSIRKGPKTGQHESERVLKENTFFC